MAGQYRQLWSVVDNVAESKRIVGKFALTAGAVGSARPSAGSAATAGAGNLFTVTQPTSGVYQVTLTESYYQVVGTGAQFAPAFATDGSTKVAAEAQPTQFDTTTNSFCVNLLNNSAALVTSATGEITFEVFIKPTAVPASL